MEMKGWFPAAKIKYDNKIYHLTIYDLTSLSQDISNELSVKQPVFFEKNLIVVETVNTKNIKTAIDYLIKIGAFASFIPEQ